MKVSPPFKLKVFVDDITALLEGRNKELAELAEKVLNKLKKEVGLEEEVRECSKRGGREWFYSCPNKFERIRGFLELISRFEFDFLRRENFLLNDSNFWCVQSSITHNVALHVHVLRPVCTHTIPIRMLWCP